MLHAVKLNQQTSMGGTILSAVASEKKNSSHNEASFFTVIRWLSGPQIRPSGETFTKNYRNHFFSLENYYVYGHVQWQTLSHYQQR